MADILRRGEAPARRVLTQFARGALRLGPALRQRAGAAAGYPEPRHPPARGRLPGRLQGQVAPDPSDGGDDAILAAGAQADAERLRARLRVCRLGPARRRRERQGRALRRRQRRRGRGLGRGLHAPGGGAGWARRSCPSRSAWSVSLVNPHDVLGYPASYERGGYAREEFRDLGVGLPPTIDEDLRDQAGGPLADAHGHDRLPRRAARTRGAARLRQLLRPPAPRGRREDRPGPEGARPGERPDSLRSRTVVVRCADHGEMGLSHGGLRQKMFNVYEETTNVPLVFSHPVLFPKATQSDALASLSTSCRPSSPSAGARCRTRCAAAT